MTVWTHPSVHTLLEEAPDTSPYETVAERARQRALEALEQGWDGPPYDPFELADMLGVDVVARQNVDDARLVSSAPDAKPRIEFNPNRRSDRIRFSIAHELGHLLFSDHGDQVRYRDEAHHAERDDDWQLEVLCNVAAAEFLMPVGAFPPAQAGDLSLPHLLDLRRIFRVSTEALLRRVIKLTSEPVFLFAAARTRDTEDFRVDYVVRSRAAQASSVSVASISADSVLAECNAVGFSADRRERWGDESVFTQAVAIPPYPGYRFPRVVGLVQPADNAAPPIEGIRYVRGDATHPKQDGPKIIAHVVNDRARSWGPRGFAPALRATFPDAASTYSEWAEDRENRQLGSVHLASAGAGQWVASLVAQAGYGDRADGQPRLRLVALERCLADLAATASELGASVHMPPIGTGQGGTPWPFVRDLVLEGLVDRGIAVTVYVLPDANMPQEEVSHPQLALL
jgi:Zn-dependent peptidase ImmA (M78 family)/O-acetyl-ADP-ribose deacetylase (regulator of RNase III)